MPVQELPAITATSHGLHIDCSDFDREIFHLSWEQIDQWRTQLEGQGAKQVAEQVAETGLASR